MLVVVLPFLESPMSDDGIFGASWPFNAWVCMPRAVLQLKFHHVIDSLWSRSATKTLYVGIITIVIDWRSWL